MTITTNEERPLLSRRTRKTLLVSAIVVFVLVVLFFILGAIAVFAPAAPAGGTVDSGIVPAPVAAPTG